jgi:two-component system phosphate regulon sensor histidine kinase PhoR
VKHTRIAFILIIIVLLPALIYTAYEFTALSQNERLVTEIYDRQMDAVLFSLNQYAWDICTSWANRVEFIYNQPPSSQEIKLKDFIKATPSIQLIFFSDSAATNLRLIPRWSNDSTRKINQGLLYTRLQSETVLLRRIIYHRQIGYSKIESLLMSPEEDKQGSVHIILLFAMEKFEQSYLIGGIALDARHFISQMLGPKMSEYAERNMRLGIFPNGVNLPEYAVGDISLESSRITKKVWLFPNYLLGIRLQDELIERMARERLYRSMALISLVDLILIAGAVLIYRNVRRESELARMKTDFVSNVSHELRTPLALIRMFAETLEMGRVHSEERRQEYYQIIMQEAGRLTHLINNILDFSRIEAGRKNFRLTTVDLNKTIRQIMQLYKFHLDNNKFTSEVQLGDMPLLIQADQEALTEAVINLIDNAMKYSEETKQIIIRTGRDGTFVFAEVEDKGIGIDASEQKKIFEKFYRVSHGLTHNTKGSGLGLALVDFTMKAHNGSVTVRSESGKGSCFRLSFPGPDGND